MLKVFRKKHISKTIWIILAILILPAFVFWGFGSYTRSKREETYAGKIGNRAISLIDYRDAYIAVKNMAIIQLGIPEDKLDEVGSYIDLNAQAWERLVLLDEARRERIRISDEEVVKQIESYPFFQRKNAFDETLYNQILQYVLRTKPRDFEEETRQNLMIRKLYETATSAIKLSDQEIKEEYRKNNEELTLQYISANPQEFAKALNPTDDELKDYFNSNQLKFKQPLSFSIEYIAFVSEGKTEFSLQETINDALMRLHRNQSLEQVAKDLKLQFKDSGFFPENGPIPGIGWAPELLTVLPKAKAGQILRPLRLDKNFYIVRLKERKEPYVPKLEECKDKVKDEFIKEKSREMARAKLEECLKTANPKDLEASAKSSGLNFGTTGSIKYDGYIEGIGTTDNLWNAGKDLKDDALSGIVELPSGFYAVKVKARVPVDEKKFAAEKNDFTVTLLSRKKSAFFQTIAEALKRRVQKY
jgi:peptidyl-prolyl cis-trans isomerase D